MNRYPLWKYLLVVAILIVSLFYAAPNLFVPDPAVQISGESSATQLTEATARQIEAALTENDIPFLSTETAEGGRNILVRLVHRDDQLRAQKVIQRGLGDGYVVALNLASTTPAWMEALGARPMKLGLDLSGGVHFLLEVDTAGAIAKRLELFSTGIKRQLREQRIRGLVDQDGLTITGRFADEEAASAAVSAVAKEYRELRAQTERRGNEVVVVWAIPEATVREIEDYAVSQNLTTLRNRVDELGVSEPLVQRQGRSRIVVELPGIQDTAEAKRILGKTANLEFRLEARPDVAPSEREYFEFRNTDLGRAGAWLERDVVITGERVANASAGFDPQTGQAEVNITLDSEGGTLMHRATRHNINRQLGVLFIERKARTRYTTDADGNEVEIRTPYDEKQIISLATIRDALGVRFRITGLSSPAEASELALLLRAGALAAPMDFVEERTVGPSLGAKNIEAGVDAMVYGIIFTAVVLVFLYKAFGIYAFLALTFNVILLVACMSMLSATLTMPGIAGIVLGMAMAVDANVLINCRIKEELRAGVSPQAAIAGGYERATGTILDANLTGVIIAIILYAIGTGPIKGFAITTLIGLL
ncbi:MAG: protein translocase subunit SecD, partial [Spongiibacteraceae bacterium]|nr:protein translocase subunit SecD [Spongiibacteraceae bacterium]